ncbi:MAG: hypothetical protein OHK0017_07640 [Patescibacteria group bacterium]
MALPRYGTPGADHFVHLVENGRYKHIGTKQSSEEAERMGRAYKHDSEDEDYHVFMSNKHGEKVKNR